MKKLLIFITVIFFLFNSITTFAAITNNVDHWAHKYAQNGMNLGWFSADRYGNISLDDEIKRAEFLAMLEKSLGLTSGSDIDTFLKTSSTNNNVIGFTDVTSHWIVSEGWMKTALNFGLVQPADYTDNKFNPDLPMTRLEAITMVARGMGRQYNASIYNDGSNLFVDWDKLPVWAKGYSSELVNFDTLLGYPDGYVKTGNNLTYGEAAALVDRASKKITEGLDASGIKVYVAEKYQGKISKQQQVDTPVIFIDNKIYVSVRKMFSAASLMYNSGSLIYHWDPKDQILSFEYGVLFQFQSGNNYIGFYNNILPYKGAFNDLSGEVRILNGDVTVPVIANGAPANLRYTGESTWDANTKTLIIGVGYPQFPLS